MPGRFLCLAGGLLSRVRNTVIETDQAQSESVQNQQEFNLDHYRSDVISNYVAKQAAKLKSDVVLIEYITLSYLCDALRELTPKPTLMIDTIDVMHIRAEHLSAIGSKNWLSISREEEKLALKKADCVLAIQDQEADLFRELLPDRKVCLTKHAVEFEVGSQRRIQKRSGPLIIGFVGSKGIANIKSLETFIKNCWGEVRNQANNEVELRVGGGIQGTDLSKELNLDGIRFDGALDNLSDYYESMDISINPALIPSGMKIKSLEALSYAVPLVATDAGLAGIKCAIEKCALVAKDWNEFTSSIMRFVHEPDLVGTFSQNCQQLIETEFSPEVVFADLKREIMQSIDS